MSNFLFGFDLGPGIAQRYRAIKDCLAMRMIGIGTKITLPLKLEYLTGFGFSQGWFNNTLS